MNTIEELSKKINHKRILVIAGTYQQFKDFCDERMRDFDELGKYEGEEYIYYSNEDSVRGCRVDDIIKYGTWYNRKDVDLDRIVIYCLKFK